MELPDPKATHSEWMAWWKDHQQTLSHIPEIVDRYEENIGQVLNTLTRAADWRGDAETPEALDEIREQVWALSQMVRTLVETNISHEAMKEVLVTQRDEILRELQEIIYQVRDMDMDHRLIRSYTRTLYKRWRRRHRPVQK